MGVYPRPNWAPTQYDCGACGPKIKIRPKRPKKKRCGRKVRAKKDESRSWIVRFVNQILEFLHLQKSNDKIAKKKKKKRRLCPSQKPTAPQTSILKKAKRSGSSKSKRSKSGCKSKSRSRTKSKRSKSGCKSKSRSRTKSKRSKSGCKSKKRRHSKSKRSKSGCKSKKRRHSKSKRSKSGCKSKKRRHSKSKRSKSGCKSKKRRQTKSKRSKSGCKSKKRRHSKSKRSKSGCKSKKRRHSKSKRSGGCCRSEKRFDSDSEDQQHSDSDEQLSTTSKRRHGSDLRRGYKVKKRAIVINPHTPRESERDMCVPSLVCNSGTLTINDIEELTLPSTSNFSEPVAYPPLEEPRI